MPINTYSITSISEVQRLLKAMKEMSKNKNNGKVNKLDCFRHSHVLRDCLISDGKYQVRLPYAEELETLH